MSDTAKTAAPAIKKPFSPWTWVPALYFIQGLPYGIVMYVATVMYKNMGMGNEELAYYTSWLYLPWVIKPFWAPIVEVLGTKRNWILLMQFVVGACLAGVAFTLPTPFWVQGTLACFWLLAFSSATHDIAADGFYMIGLRSDQQAFFVGIRSLAFRLSMLFTQGAVVWMGGYLEQTTGNISAAWAYVMGASGAVMFLMALYHLLVLPRAERERSAQTVNQVVSEFGATFLSFFRKPGVWMAIGFLLCYRLGEALLVKMAQPFLLDKLEVGGLGLSTQEVGIAYGTAGPAGLILGGILGGIAISRKGLRYWLWPMLAAINLPHLTYIFLAYVLPSNLYLISGAVAVETFGYGFGFAAYMVYMMYFADGPYKTAHYALCSGFMALSMMLPGMVSGWLQEQLGYQHYFLFILACALPSILIVARLKVDAAYGRKQD